jgi:hypothetical protein
LRALTIDGVAGRLGDILEDPLVRTTIRFVFDIPFTGFALFAKACPPTKNTMRNRDKLFTEISFDDLLYPDL